MAEKEYIERKAAIRAHCDGCVDDGYCGKFDGRYACEYVPNIMAISAADVRPVVHGKWVDKCVRDWRCSECGCDILKVRRGYAARKRGGGAVKLPLRVSYNKLATNMQQTCNYCGG